MFVFSLYFWFHHRFCSDDITILFSLSFSFSPSSTVLLGCVNKLLRGSLLGWVPFVSSSFFFLRLLDPSTHLRRALLNEYLYLVGLSSLSFSLFILLRVIISSFFFSYIVTSYSLELSGHRVYSPSFSLFSLWVCSQLFFFSPSFFSTSACSLRQSTPLPCGSNVLSIFSLLSNLYSHSFSTRHTCCCVRLRGARCCLPIISYHLFFSTFSF